MGFGRFEMRVSDAEIPSSEVRFRNAKAQITISSLKVRNWMFQISISVFELFPRTLRGNISKFRKHISAAVFRTSASKISDDWGVGQKFSNHVVIKSFEMLTK